MAESGAAGLAAATAALHDRVGLAFAAAIDADLPGTFRTFRSGELRALLTTSPGLSFLNTVSGVDEDSAPGLPGVRAACRDAGAPRPTLVGGLPTDGLDGVLRRLGHRPAAPAPVAVMALPPAGTPGRPPAPHIRVTSADDGPARDLFLDVLQRGYDAPPAVTRFVLTEHASPSVRCFLAWRGTEPIAAAALSVHRTGVVLGGAATLAGQRGHGAQRALLHHRIGVAAATGADLATATAAPESPSVRNLARAGFEVVARCRWSAPDAGSPRPWCTT